MRRIGVELFGLMTCVCTVAIVLAVRWWFGTDLFGLFLYMLIPVGAIGCGFAAASGYFLGSFVFDRPPRGMLLVNMVLIGVASFFLIHFAQYCLALHSVREALNLE